MQAAIMSVSDALRPPPGVKIDYVHSIDRGYQVVDASLISISLAAILVSVRLVVKAGITHSFGWDDCMHSSARCSKLSTADV